MRRRSHFTRRSALLSGAAVLATPVFAQQPQLKTPGVYITEIDAFPNAVVAAPTSIVAFIGPGGDPHAAEQSFTSMAEYLSLHGVEPLPRFSFERAGIAEHGPASLMQRAIRWFYENGGGTAYAVSAPRQDEGLSLQAMLEALETVGDIADVTLLAAPDAVRLSIDDCYALQSAMLAQCERRGDRFAILDVHPDAGDGPVEQAARFGDAIGDAGLAYGAAYLPAIRTSIEDAVAYRFYQFGPPDRLAEILILQDTAAGNYVPRFEEVYGRIAAFNGADALAGDETLRRQAIPLDDALRTVSPAYKSALDETLRLRNLMPPSPGVAGAYVRTDNEQGVWISPANISLAAAVEPSVAMNSETTSDLNVPVNGRAVNPIRSFLGMGTLIWGGRTLDGNSIDNRYISVRRTTIMLRSSIESALATFVFEPNDANTWTSVRSMLSNFLSGMWKGGALSGAVPDDAFAVRCGLGTTMTAQDILDNKLLVTVTVAIVRPAEFQVLNFEIAMAER